MEISYLLLILTCLFYGITGIITDWDELSTKLINSIIIIAIIVLVLITGDDGFFRRSDDFWWFSYALPIPVIWIFTEIGNAISNDEWRTVAAVFTVIGFVATIITTCCGV